MQEDLQLSSGEKNKKEGKKEEEVRIWIKKAGENCVLWNGERKRRGVLGETRKKIQAKGKRRNLNALHLSLLKVGRVLDKISLRTW